MSTEREFITSELAKTVVESWEAAPIRSSRWS